MNVFANKIRLFIQPIVGCVICMHFIASATPFNAFVVVIVEHLISRHEHKRLIICCLGISVASEQSERDTMKNWQSKPMTMLRVIIYVRFKWRKIECVTKMEYVRLWCQPKIVG